MSIQDPIADMLTAIRNGQCAKKYEVCIPSSAMKLAIVNVLKEEGFIKQYDTKTDVKSKVILKIYLKYYQKKKPVIENIKRVSKPGLRVYRGRKKLPKVVSGMGIAIISTSRGVMTDKKARLLNVGGEVLCYVS